MIAPELIPPDKLPAITRALHEAFGTTELEDVRPITGGHTGALVFRIMVRSTSYLLRITMRPNDATLPQHFTCLKAAAQAGLAPRLWYTNIEDQLSITDFVEAVPFPFPEAHLRMARVLRHLHALPPFPTRASHLNTTCTFLLNEGLAVDGFIQRFRASGILPKEETEELLARYTKIAAAFPHIGADHPDMVSSHNDLFKPDNILFDAQRVWLVDWEAAFLNHRYADLAVVANLTVTNDAEEQAYLQEYFGQEPDEHQRARLFLVRQLAHMFYAMAFLSMGSAGETVPPQTASEVDNFQRRFWQRDLELVDKPSKALYSRFHWNQMLQNVRHPRFDEALNIASRPAPRLTSPE